METQPNNTPVYIPEPPIRHGPHILQKPEVTGIIILTLLVGGYFLYAFFAHVWPFSSGSVFGDSAVNDLPMATWLTYRSDAYEFEFKYPPEFTVIQEEGATETEK